MSKRPRRIHTDIAHLPEDLRRLIERLLIEGAMFEDVVEAIEEREGDGVALSAVQHLFRSNPDLQQKRIQRQLEVARGLKKATGNPRSAQDQLTQALILTGMMRLNRSGADFEVKDAVRSHQQEENQRLREQLVRATQQNLSIKLKASNDRLKTEAERRRFLKARVRELQSSFQKDGGSRQTPEELLQKIREIYGLVSEPHEENTETAQA